MTKKATGTMSVTFHLDSGFQTIADCKGATCPTMGWTRASKLFWKPVSKSKLFWKPVCSTC